MESATRSSFGMQEFSPLCARGTFDENMGTVRNSQHSLYIPGADIPEAPTRHAPGDVAKPRQVPEGPVCQCSGEKTYGFRYGVDAGAGRRTASSAPPVADVQLATMLSMLSVRLHPGTVVAMPSTSTSHRDDRSLTKQLRLVCRFGDVSWPALACYGGSRGNTRHSGTDSLHVLCY